MIKIRKDSNLSVLGRLGLPALILGAAFTAFSAGIALRYPDEGDAWLALAISVGILLSGIMAIAYSWWLDWKESPQRRDNAGL